LGIYEVEECDCVSCKDRNEKMEKVDARSSTRNGEKRGFWKYGEGQALDD
jgi:hypothetical protein